jgi:hypothetical protein
MLALPLLLLLAAGPVVVPEPAPPPAATNEVQAPVFAGNGYTKPREARRGCIMKKLRLPNGDRSWGLTTFKFAVHEDGTADQVEALSDTPPVLVAAFAEAVRQCEFIPGKDPAGRPVVIWLIMPIRFVEAGH